MSSTALTCFRHWATHAPYGDEFVYNRGEDRDDDLFTLARKLSEAGLVFLYQRRAGCTWEKVARRTPVVSHKVLDAISQDVIVPPSSACLKERGIAA